MIVGVHDWTFDFKTLFFCQVTHWETMGFGLPQMVIIQKWIDRVLFSDS